MLKKITLFFLSIIISSVAFTQIYNYTYTGGVQTFTAPSSGSYEFQLWGASGGRDGQIGGSGGYATAQMFLSLGQTVTVVVGGEGLGCNANSGGGYNGGGNAGPSGCSGGGGGATDVRVGGTALSNRMIVAGGGGGGGNGGVGVGGAGGGSTGQTASGQGGTQSSGGGGSPAGSLGQGGNKSGDGGGGGGGYYGGGAAYSDAGGGGGSGYVNSSLTNRTLIAGNLTMPNPNGGTMTGRRGNGYARITLSYSVSISQTTSVSCNGGSNGALTATAVGGTPPYTYNWSNSGTTQSITGLGAGLYSVTVTGSNAAAASASFTITEPAALASSSAVTANISCNGGSNGSATASATGGTTPYTYVWSNAATTASITGVIAGTYTVTISDANSCTSTSSVTITEPAVLSASSAVTANISCNGSSNGSATASATGGTTPYTYVWSNAATTASITGVVAGTYTVTISDANSCTSTSSVTITEPAALASSSAVTANISCNGGSNGSATASATGGTTPYTYVWSNAATTASITGVVAGTYTVTISDANSCTSTLSVTITEPAALASSSAVTANISCNGGSNGSATASATGGTTPYTYVWSNAATTASITGVIAGTYTVTISDANSCTSTSSVTITEPAALSASSAVTANISCNGGSNGSATASATGGTTPYTYVWSNAATTASITGVVAGTYTVTISDANSCTSTSSVTITEPAALASSSAVTANISCNGGSNGSATASATGGTTPYAYVWSNAATTASITGVIAGTYTVTISDANSCTSTSSVTITEPAALSASSAVTANISCNGGSNGSATASATGGTTPYTYVWSNAATTASITGVVAGTYTVTISDANSCTSTSSVTITEPAALSASSAVTANISCNGGSNGSATASATGGTTPYTYVWSNAATTASITGVIAGTYTVTVTDFNNCVSTANITITEPSLLISSIIISSCDSYTWNQNNMMYTTSGAYTDTITNALGCDSVITLNLTINNSTASSSSVTSCDSYTWNQNNMMYTTSGAYTDTITNALGCDSVITLNLTINNSTASSSSVTSCDSYTWNQNNMMYTTSGAYTDTITNALGCDSVITLNLTINNSTASSSSVTSCDSYTWNQNNMMYTTSGAYTDTITNALGCDSVITLNLTINNSTASSSSVTSCDSYTWNQNNMMYTTSGAYTDTITNALGCDSVITLNLTINNSTASSSSVTSCDSYTWNQNNMMYTTSGAYTDTITNALGCDSVITLNLTINNSTASSSSVTSCDSYTWNQNNMMYTTSGAYTDTITNALGCDSVITLNLTINNSTASSSSVTSCDSYTWNQNNMMYTTSGAYTDTITNALGCDSVITLNLTINNSTASSSSVTSCDSYTWNQNNMMYTTSGAYTDTITNALGCDSVITLNLIIDTLDLTITNINGSLASNEANAISYQWINCDSNNAIIAGASNQGYLPVMSGNYAVIINKGGCTDTSACVNIIITGLVERSVSAKYTIYPNPTAGNLYVELGREPEIGSTIEVYNLTGQLVQEFQIKDRKTLIDISHFEKSVYFFKYGDKMIKIILSH